MVNQAAARSLGNFLDQARTKRGKQNDLASRIQLRGGNGSGNSGAKPTGSQAASSPSLADRIVMPNGSRASSSTGAAGLTNSRSTRVNKSMPLSNSLPANVPKGPRRRNSNTGGSNSNSNSRRNKNQAYVAKYSDDDLINTAAFSPAAQSHGYGQSTSQNHHQLYAQTSTAGTSPATATGLAPHPTLASSGAQYLYAPSNSRIGTVPDEDLTIKGLGAPIVVVARNFVPGTSAADLETVLQSNGFGDGLLSCRITGTDPVVVAELRYSEFEYAQAVVAFFDHRRADGQLLHVFIPDSRTLGLGSVTVGVGAGSGGGAGGGSGAGRVESTGATQPTGPLLPTGPRDGRGGGSRYSGRY